ncbi:MAG: hypothetical protein H0U95_12990 [Bacteroidetes bacterium]|nr:hypothetical protein [Bacteroidota bacterium]
MKNVLIASLFLLLFISCKKKETVTEDPTPEPTPVVSCPTCNFPDTIWTSAATGPKLIFKFKFDSTQVRLNNFGLPSTIPVANAGQSPVFNGMSAHYIEMAKYDTTQVGHGVILYRAEETNCSGNNAIVFCKSVVAKEGDVFFSVPINNIAPGSYKWLRVSLAYQNYDIKVRVNTNNLTGTVASFVGFNTYVSKFKMHNAVMTPTINGAGNKLQGYWGFYTNYLSTDVRIEGQAAQTTVVNPNSTNSPIPAGSCLVTGQFYSNSASSVQPLVITGTETNDIIITVSLSTNKSFEWKETTFDGRYQPDANETVVDMGLRGMIPKFN